jgi:hypothetical protein
MIRKSNKYKGKSSKQLRTKMNLTRREFIKKIGKKVLITSALYEAISLVPFLMGCGDGGSSSDIKGCDKDCIACTTLCTGGCTTACTTSCTRCTASGGCIGSCIVCTTCIACTYGQTP